MQRQLQFVSGAVAERIKLKAFVIFSIVYLTFIYPIAGSWKWGGGFLDKWGFYDFAGSTLVHSVGGWAALVGAWMLGARHNKYSKNGAIKPIPGHSMPLACLGAILLWFGWFGFNGGSVLSAEPSIISLVFVNTSVAAAAGGLAAMIITQLFFKSLDLSMSLNGILAGLVGITAGADLMSVNDSLIIGLISGILVVFSVLFFDKKKIDDPVGAISVHLVCGVFGTLVVGILGAKASMSQLWIQFVSIIIYGVFCVVSSLIIFGIIRKTVGLRVDKEEEIEGLDLAEHKTHSYIINSSKN